MQLREMAPISPCMRNRLPTLDATPHRSAACSLSEEQYLCDIGRKQVRPPGLFAACACVRLHGKVAGAFAAAVLLLSATKWDLMHPLLPPARCAVCAAPQAPNFSQDSRRLIYQVFRAYEVVRDTMKAGVILRV